MAQATAAAPTQAKRTAAPSASNLPVWKWEGKTKQGEAKNGEMEAADDAAVKQRLTAMGIQPVKVKKKPKELKFKLPGFSGVSTKDILIFTRQFSVMIDAGLPLVQA